MHTESIRFDGAESRPDCNFDFDYTVVDYRRCLDLPSYVPSRWVRPPFQTEIPKFIHVVARDNTVA